MSPRARIVVPSRFPPIRVSRAVSLALAPALALATRRRARASSRAPFARARSSRAPRSVAVVGRTLEFDARARRDASEALEDDDDAHEFDDFIVRVFCRVEGDEKQATASTTRGDGANEPRVTRAEACERACAGGCERAAAGAEASEDAGETCALACAEACERRADANGKFEVTLTRGSEEMRRFEQAIATREAREREAVERLAELERDEKARGEGGGRDGE